MKKLGFLSLLCAAALTGTAWFAASTEARKAEAPAASSTLVLSQVYGGGGGSTGTYLFDYVEIKNISSTPQSLSGLSVMYGSATGQFASTATNAFALPAATLQPGQYFLVQLGSTGSAGAALPTPDVTTTNLSMSASSGKVALVTSAFTANTCGASATPCALPNANIIDLVAYGAANNAEGNAPTNLATALTSTQGNVRKGAGCTDTDNNNADFDVLNAPVPRNSATTAAPCSSAASVQHVVDFNGDGKTDIAVVRNTGGGPGGQITWFYNPIGTGTTSAIAWGISGDNFTPVDFDGDSKSDVAVWRAGAAGTAAFYILNSSTNTVRIDTFGQTGDDPSVVDDYDGDGKADPAVYRTGANSGDPSTWYYRGSLNNAGGNVTFVPWGQNGDFPAPGDYDGDGKNDFVVQRNNGGGQARFWMLQSTAGFSSVVFGTPTDVIVPGDYDGDGKTDLAVVRGSAGQYNWYVRPSTTGVISGGPTAVFGASATDFFTHGDYDGDGKTDFAVWRPSATPGASAFWVLGSTAGTFSVPFGQNGDYAVANYNRH